MAFAGLLALVVAVVALGTGSSYLLDGNLAGVPLAAVGLLGLGLGYCASSYTRRRLAGLDGSERRNGGRHDVG